MANSSTTTLVHCYSVCSRTQPYSKAYSVKTLHLVETGYTNQQILSCWFSECCVQRVQHCVQQQCCWDGMVGCLGAPNAWPCYALELSLHLYFLSEVSLTTHHGNSFTWWKKHPEVTHALSRTRMSLYAVVAHLKSLFKHSCVSCRRTPQNTPAEEHIMQYIQRGKGYVSPHPPSYTYTCFFLQLLLHVSMLWGNVWNVKVTHTAFLQLWPSLQLWVYCPEDWCHQTALSIG